MLDDKALVVAVYTGMAVCEPADRFLASAASEFLTESRRTRAWAPSKSQSTSPKYIGCRTLAHFAIYFLHPTPEMRLSDEQHGAGNDEEAEGCVVVASWSHASLRQRPAWAMVRSTTHRQGWTAKPFCLGGR